MVVYNKYDNIWIFEFLYVSNENVDAKHKIFSTCLKKNYKYQSIDLIEWISKHGIENNLWDIIMKHEPI